MTYATHNLGQRGCAKRASFSFVWGLSSPNGCVLNALSFLVWTASEKLLSKSGIPLFVLRGLCISTLLSLDNWFRTCTTFRESFSELVDHGRGELSF